MKELVTVIMPTYNHDKYIERAINSVLCQTYNNWELIIIDNHSTDNTEKIIKNFSDNRIKFLSIKNKGVIAASRNLGIKNAKGTWVAFLDSDDWWEKEKLMLCLSSINSDIDFIYHNMKINREKTQLVFKKVIKARQLKAPVLLDLLNTGNIICNSSVIVRKNLLNSGRRIPIS